MDNGSAIEYWEKFSEHAFDNAESGVTMSVILMSPAYRPVPCTFCFTLKRDIFDLPCVVVGNVKYRVSFFHFRCILRGFLLIFVHLFSFYRYWVQMRISHLH